MGNGRTSETERWSDLEKYLLKPSVNIITREDIWNRKERRVAERVATTDREHVDWASLSQGECKHSSPQAAGQTNTQLVTSTTNTCSCWPSHSPPRVPTFRLADPPAPTTDVRRWPPASRWKMLGRTRSTYFWTVSDSCQTPPTHPPTHPDTAEGVGGGIWMGGYG